MSFGDRVRRRRTDLGLSLADVGRRLGITRGAISHYEQGRDEPKYTRLKKLAEVLECSPIWLLYGRDEHISVDFTYAEGFIDSGGILIAASAIDCRVPALLPADLSARSWLMRAQVGPFMSGDVIYIVPPNKVSLQHLSLGRPAVVEAPDGMVLARSVMPAGQKDHFSIFLFDGQSMQLVKSPVVWPVVASISSAGYEIVQSLISKLP